MDAPQENYKPVTWASEDLGSNLVERYTFSRNKGRVIRNIQISETTHSSSVRFIDGSPTENASSAFDWCWLRQKQPPKNPHRRQLRIADLFSGCGQMTLGVSEAARALGLFPSPALIVDSNASAAKACELNFGSEPVQKIDITEILKGETGGSLRSSERTLRTSVGPVDILVGGPPCQGHSDLNNHTRRSDPRNNLGLKMVRFAEVFRPRFIIIENVRGIVHDRSSVFRRIEDGLSSLGYKIASALVSACEVGVPQKRLRQFLIAGLSPSADLDRVFEIPPMPSRSFRWACEDLAFVENMGPLSQLPRFSSANRSRIQYLFDHDVYDLPDEERPTCHRSGSHSYKSVYGRISWDSPTQTITTGFRCMGQGRYVHPSRPRTLTAREAARVQFIPDFFKFPKVGPTSLARMIGNAVPPKLVYSIALRLLMPMC